MSKSGIERARLAGRLALALRRSRVVALTGPRQCGKTTLARALAAGRNGAGAVPHGAYFDLEDPVAAARLAEPVTALGILRGLVVIDEVQRAPHLFPVLRVLADRTPSRARFLLLGSASPELMRQASESLAGRVEFVDMAGFMLEEVGEDVLHRLWQRGGFPRSFLARGEAASLTWREDFIRTFLERDVRNLGINVPAAALRRLWTMLAHYHGQVWNASEIGRALGEAHTTVKRHVDSLCGALVVRQLQPWFENLGKRQIKAPKVYVRDSGLLHALLGIGSAAALAQHPKIGASWEGFVIEQVLAVVGERNAYYWGTQSGAELDLLVLRGGKRYGVEVKNADAPRLTKSMAIAQHDLGLERLFVVYPGSEAYPLGKNAVALGLAELLQNFK
jgi:predicted AAA+ superfamily ATPase